MLGITDIDNVTNRAIQPTRGTDPFAQNNWFNPKIDWLAAYDYWQQVFALQKPITDGRLACSYMKTQFQPTWLISTH